jgi:hypothetical protein
MDRTHLEKGLASGRLSGGFTLDEAARLHRRTAAGRPVLCPGCGDAMHGVVGSHPDGSLSLLRCPSCGRGVVLDRPPPPDDA